MRLHGEFDMGDVIYTNCSDISGVCYHLGIVFDDGKQKLVFHNAPNNQNKYGGTVVCENIEDFLKDRYIIKVEKTNATNDNILRVTKLCRHEIWDTFYFNCEDYVVQIVDGERNSDLRDAWKIGALGIVLLLIY
jgi:hypothetical protein